MEEFGLTKREVQILAQIALGLSSKEIAQNLGISARTVESHTNSLRKKMGARKRTRLAAIATMLSMSDQTSAV